jgi:hypothetical protein
MATRLTANTVVFPDGSQQGERAERILLANISITTTGATYTLLDYDAGIDCEVWDSQIARPMLTHGISSLFGGWTYYNNAYNTNTVRFGMRTGSNVNGHWERTRWSGPHRYLFNFQWSTTGIATLDITCNINLYYMTNVGT